MKKQVAEHQLAALQERLKTATGGRLKFMGLESVPGLKAGVDQVQSREDSISAEQKTNLDEKAAFKARVEVGKRHLTKNKAEDAEHAKAFAALSVEDQNKYISNREKQIADLKTLVEGHSELLKKEAAAVVASDENLAVALSVINSAENNPTVHPSVAAVVAYRKSIDAFQNAHDKTDGYLSSVTGEDMTSLEIKTHCANLREMNVALDLMSSMRNALDQPMQDLMSEYALHDQQDQSAAVADLLKNEIKTPALMDMKKLISAEIARFGSLAYAWLYTKESLSAGGTNTWNAGAYVLTGAWNVSAYVLTGGYNVGAWTLGKGSDLVTVVMNSPAAIKKMFMGDDPTVSNNQGVVGSTVNAKDLSPAAKASISASGNSSDVDLTAVTVSVEKAVRDDVENTGAQPGYGSGSED